MALLDTLEITRGRGAPLDIRALPTECWIFAHDCSSRVTNAFRALRFRRGGIVMQVARLAGWTE